MLLKTHCKITYSASESAITLWLQRGFGS